MLTARSHAYLFGVIARETIDTFGEMGEQAIAKGVVLYGQQRGRRMAMRAAADGLESSALNYVLYGEWSSAPSEMDFSILSKSPNFRLVIPLLTRCIATFEPIPPVPAIPIFIIMSPNLYT